MLASCSSRVAAPDFFEAARAGVTEAGRTLVGEETTVHAADHPARFPQSLYLKCLFASLA